MFDMQVVAARPKSSLPFDPTYAALTLTALLWSTNFIIGRAVRDDVSPAALNFLRWAVALLILVPITLRDVHAHRATLMRHWKLILPNPAVKRRGSRRPVGRRTRFLSA